VRICLSEPEYFSR